MARRNIKFSLKMKNGAEVRSLDELRENADVESVMGYYFNGQLSRWCKAFDYAELPDTFSEINESFIKSICDALNLHISVDEMQEYISNSFGLSETSRIREDIENEEEIIDDADIKEKLKSYTSANLDDYEISAVPVENENSRVEKYRVSVSCEKTEQYNRFCIPYGIDDTKEDFEDYLYEKISYAIKSMKESMEYNMIKKEHYERLKVGDKFKFGKFDGKAIEWKVIRKDVNSVYVLCTSILCNRQFSVSNSNNWNNSDIRKWLNNDFYNTAFSTREKGFIGDVSGDKITLLKKKEAEQLLDKNEITLDSWWWLRSACPYNSDYVRYVSSDGAINSNHANRSGGVCPAFNLKF